ncbi:MBL fold metallo-hydrolase [Oceaniovalibus sp. ACAM 378]|uniref:MBL fold metallo-hydrolase n=1 Tax=Oceaniovalibus sp. ACAM 378 TaxID=2599923 RepID=UPI0011D97D7C|nr:MBL fold metallo-hydrolase [Oceaniovalibus sp. ACAM 378]TYB89735.1 MBL fold metallo-hydrolase [Oceaniovalibus sp. ACAM 378]
MENPQDFDPVPGESVVLCEGLRRVLAPNPSPMTFRGTNTYILGQGRVAVIDPGPENPAHLAALHRALRGETVSHIFVTHAHLDHSPLARRLARDTGAPVLAFGGAGAGRSSLMSDLAARGLSGGGEGVDTAFTPDIRLADGETVQGDGWSVNALHTPGHMANHIALSWGDVLFSGDHVMGWSTSLVSPPDGDLAAFIASCQRLQRLSHRVIHPGHGAPVTDPAARLSALIAHRQARTLQIRAALESGARSITQVRAAVYADLPPHLFAAAERNIFAHLIDLAAGNLVHALPELSIHADFQPVQKN